MSLAWVVSLYVVISVYSGLMELRTRKTTNHLKHLTWGVLTGGLWLITGYPICVLLNRRARSITVVR